MNENFRQFVECVDLILSEVEFSRFGCLWRKEYTETYVGFRLMYSPETDSISGFFGASAKALLAMPIDEFDIGLWDSHIHGNIGVQVSNSSHIKFQCALLLNNQDYKFLEEYYGEDRVFHKNKLDYLKKPPHSLSSKIKIFMTIFKAEIVPLLEMLNSEEGIKKLIFDSRYGFTVWDSLAVHLGVFTKKQSELGVNNLSEYNYKTFVTL